MKNKKIFVLFLVLIIAWLIFITYNQLFKKEEDVTSEISEYTITGISSDLTKVVESNKTAIVSIEQDGNVSTGFIYNKIDSDLYIVTCLHSVQGQGEINAYLNNGAKFKCEIYGEDVHLDLALLKCECPYDVLPIEFGDSKLAKDGEFVISIGTCNSLKYDFSSQFGMISSKYREIENDVTYKKENYNYNLAMIQLSGEFKSGYSGAPVFNMMGQVIGVISSKDDDVTLACTANETKMVLNKLLNNEEYYRLDIGITGQYISELENYEKINLNIGLDVVEGYFVDNVKVGSFASNIGITKGDIILSINQLPIKDFDSMLEVMYSNQKEYVFSIIRNNETQEIIGTIND